MADAGGRAGGGPGRASGPRLIAIVGPFQSGKTTLLEEILSRTGAVARRGTVEAGNTVGDSSAEARKAKMSVEATFATTRFMDEDYTFVDLPGSVEFAGEARAILPACDAAIVVCEADEKKAPQLQLILRDLEDLGVPRFLFLNKIDKSDKRVRETVALLQPASRTPLVLRQIPIWSNGVATGFVDLALERAFVYREHANSEVVPLKGEDLDREKEARFAMLERLADHDDALMESLLEEIEPPADRVFGDLALELKLGQIVPVLIGSAARGNGVLRLLKALRHEAPGVSETARRLGVDGAASAVIKSVHTPHAGKMSVVRVLAGEIGDGQPIVAASGATGQASGTFRLFGANVEKRGPARAGETVGLGKLDAVKTGDVLALGKAAPRPFVSLRTDHPALSLALAAKERKDDVKLGAALSKLADEDPSLIVEHHGETGEILVRGQGEIHLRVATERLAGRFGVPIVSRAPRLGYRETIRKGISLRARHKKQTGGHGQFGDVAVEVKPLPRGSGFVFKETVTGGAVPRQYFPSVEEGVRSALKEGPLGFPVIDVEVTLTDGSYHSVDSSDMAFQMAGRLAMHEALPQCQPVLLEPIHKVEVVCPSEASAKINAILSARRAQIRGFDARDDWPGWDIVRALMPESEIGDLVIELRSATAGVGSYTATFDHLAEISGKPAEAIIAARRHEMGR
jgi:elongation factor G